MTEVQAAELLRILHSLDQTGHIVVVLMTVVLALWVWLEAE